MVKTKHKPPSRIRYEQNNPIVSFRIEKHLYEELKELLKNQGTSIGGFFRVALKKQQIDYEELGQSEYDKGFNDGYDDGFGTFKVPCKICGKPMQFDIMKEPEAKQIVREAFAKWGHTDCLNE